eukprot:scaffold53932_cov34-Tisochrysis_lutea.AAC.2
MGLHQGYVDLARRRSPSPPDRYILEVAAAQILTPGGARPPALLHEALLLQLLSLCLGGIRATIARSPRARAWHARHSRAEQGRRRSRVCRQLPKETTRACEHEEARGCGGGRLKCTPHAWWRKINLADAYS